MSQAALASSHYHHFFPEQVGACKQSMRRSVAGMGGSDLSGFGEIDLEAAVFAGAKAIQVAARRKDVKDSFHDVAQIITSSLPQPFSLRYQGCTQRPFLIRRITARHTCSVCPMSQRQEAIQISAISYKSYVNMASPLWDRSRASCISVNSYTQ